MFLLNSRSHQFIATPSPFWREPVKLQGRTLSRSYGTNLPSSFSRVLSSALEYSSRPPVSVCGTVTVKLKLRGFSWNHFQLLLLRRAWPRTLEFRARICQSAFSNARTGTSNTRTTFRDPSPHRISQWCRNIDLLPISYAFLPRLRGRLTLRR